MKARKLGILTFTAAATLLLLTGTARASCVSYYCTDTISMLVVDATGVSVRLTSDLTGLTNCTPTGGIYLRVPKSDTNYNSYYAMLLSAKLTAQAISFRTIDNSTDCSVGYMYIM
jgi:hypothetical protein